MCCMLPVLATDGHSHCSLPFLQFHLETAKKRAQQRMREGRAKPIDALAINLFLMEEFDVNMTAPYSVFIGLTLDDVEELCDDIKGYQVCSGSIFKSKHSYVTKAAVEGS